MHTEGERISESCRQGLGERRSGRWNEHKSNRRRVIGSASFTRKRCFIRRPVTHERYPEDLCSPSPHIKAAGNGDTAMTQWFLENRWMELSGAAGFFDPLGAAVSSGKLDAVIWLHTAAMRRLCPSMMGKAAANGHLHVMEWLRKHSTDGCSVMAIDSAAMNGHLTRAAWNGNLEMLMWLHQNYQLEEPEETPESDFDKAAAGGFLHVVQWLHVNRSQDRCTKQAMDHADANGLLDMVQWLYENRSEGCTARALLPTAIYESFNSCTRTVEEDAP
ncbi:hypothetical protein FI667_g8652, partial [Globisporangium splendens]